MYRRFGLLYTVFSLLVLAVLIILVVVRLNTIREFNIQESQTSFIRLQGRLRESYSGDSRWDPGPAIRGYVQLVPTVDAVTLYDPNRGIRFVWTSNVDTLAFGREALDEFSGFPAYEINEITQIKLTTPFTVGDAKLYLDGIYTVLTFEDAYPPLRDSLIALLAFAFLTVLIAIVVNVSQGPRSDSERKETPSSSSAGGGARTSSSPATSGTGPADTRFEATAAGRTADEGTAPGRTAASGPDSQAGGGTAPAREFPAGASEPEPLLEEVDLEEIATDPGEPGTLFNPVTNLSYREHLEKRLGLELERAAYNDQDLTCMLIRFEDARAGGEAYSRRAEEVLSAFKFEDLCFEYGADTFCVILPNTELSRGIREAEAFKSDHSGRMSVGLSARNGRLVESSRVLGEAERSLEHAQREPGGIVGFRPDPRKYRQFVTQHLGPAE